MSDQFDDHIGMAKELQRAYMEKRLEFEEANREYEELKMAGIREQMEAIKQEIYKNQQMMAMPRIFIQKTISYKGQNIKVSDKEYDRIMEMGWEALEREKQFKQDFTDIIEKKDE